jgi:enoyl-CoA hydratase/carnithine racemase
MKAEMTAGVRLDVVHDTQGHYLGIRRVVLVHPSKRNAMTRAMWQQLQTVFVQLQSDAHARCILI